MSKFSLSSLRSRAIVLVLLAIFPLLALTLYSYFDQREQAIREVQRDELVTVRNLAVIQETMINNTRQLLMTLARLPQLQHRDRDACNALFAALLKQNPSSASIGATDSEGRLFASAPAAPGPVNFADRTWFQKIVQNRDLVIGETVVGRISGKYGNNLAYPIIDGEGRFQGALTTQLDLNWLGGLLAKSDFPPATALVLTDSSRKVLFRYPDPLKYIGKMLPDFLVKGMDSSDEGVAAGIGLPGDARLFAFVRLSPPWEKMWVFIGLPRDWAVGPVNRTLWRNLIWLALVALFAIAAAWYGGDLFISRPVKKLRAVTERLAAGDLTVRSGPDYSVGELGLLAQSFDQMADSLQERAEALKQSEEHYRSLFDNMLNGYAYCRMHFEDHRPVDWTYLRVNQAFETLTGLTDVEGKKISKVIPGLRESDPQLFEIYGRVALTGVPESFETYVAALDRWFAISVYGPQIDHFVAIFEAITERKQAEDALRESEDRFRTMANAIPQLAWIAKSDGYIFWYNQRWYDYTGATPEDMEGWGWQSVHDPKALPQVIEQWRASIATGLPFDMVFPLRGADGQFRQFLTRGVPLKDSSGKVIQWFGTNTDITERKQAEEKLHRTLADLERSNRDLEDFAYISSHDLQEPLRKIANFSEMLARQYQAQLDDQAQRYFGYVADGAKRMQALINALLTYSRVGRAEIPLISAGLEDILQGTLNDLQELIRESGAEISYDPLPTLTVNPHLMRQLLQNLIANAIKFHGDQPPRIHLSAGREGDEWVISLRDNGIGFDPQHAEQIFKVFKRLHTKEAYPGTGIGLAICKKIIERHGGRIWAESEPRRGSTFFFSIPA